MASKKPLLYTGTNRAAYARGILRIQDSLAVKWRNVLYREFIRVNKELSTSYTLFRTSKFQEIQQSHKENVEVIFRKMVGETAKRFAPAPVSGVKKVYSTILEEEAVEYAINLSLRRVEGVAATTIRLARRIIARGIENELSLSQIGKDLQSSASAVTARSRGTTIARTEIHTAANASAHKMAVSSGVSLKREWIASNDDRTRDDHGAADGQKVGPEEEFEVGGEEMMYPGDPSGSPENVINCRCVVAYVPQDGDGNE